MNKLWIVVIVAVLLLLTLGGVAGHQMTKGDAFCSSCHAYERASWDHGMHPNVGCLECHTGGFVRDKTMNNCVGCHMSDAAIEAHPYFATRHSEYTQAAQFCISCHEAGHVEAIRNQRYLSVRRSE